MNPQKFAQRLILICAFVAAPFLLAACSLSTSSTCSSITIDYTLDQGEADYLAYELGIAGGVDLTVVNGSTPLGSAQITANLDNHLAVSFPEQSPGTQLSIYLGPQYIDSFPACGNTNAVTWFTPGDGRIDGQPGDRIAVYCDKKTQTVLVWGVKPDSRGVFLGVFPNSDLLKAGTAGIFKPDGVGGQISVDTDGKGNYWAAWNGGQFNADGQPKSGFAKGIHCDFTQ